MPYAQVSDVRAKAPSIPVNASTKPSDGDVQNYLTEVEAEINAILANLGYQTPVPGTATQSLLMLKDLVSQGALAKLLMGRALGVDSSLVESAIVVEKKYEARLKALRTSNDPYELPDAPTTDLAVTKTPDERSASFADESFDDFDAEAPRVTRAQGF